MRLRPPEGSVPSGDFFLYFVSQYASLEVLVELEARLVIYTNSVFWISL